MQADPFRVMRVSVEKIIPLRHITLRSGQPIEAAQWADDATPSARHYALLHNDTILSCASKVALG